MFQNYLKIALRYMARNKAYSFINIVGLSVGMAVFTLIGLWINDELSYNKSFSHYDRIVSIVRQFEYNSIRIDLPGTPLVMRDELMKKYSDVFQSVVLTTDIGDHKVVVDDKPYFKKGSFMDPDAAELLSLHMMEGQWEGLQQPAGVLLSASLAANLFGKTDPLGQRIQIDGESDARVMGVYADLPYNTSFRDLGFIASLDLYVSAHPDIKTAANPWLYQDRFTAYALLKRGVDVNSASIRIRDIRKGKIPDEYYKTIKPIDYLHPMSKWHLYSDFESNTGYKVRKKIVYVRALGIIGIFVLLLACINFINLSTARSEKRAREVGIRKTIGSMRVQLMSQFLLESLVAVVLAFLLALLWVNLALPGFNAIGDKRIEFPWTSVAFWAASILFVFITGLIAGLYPAFYLSSFRPVKVLKGTFRSGRLAALPRRALVVFQFTVSVSLIICTLIIYHQVQYAFDRPIGYNRDGLIMINMTPDIRKNYSIIGDELKRSQAVVSLAASQNTTVDYNIDENRLSWEGKDPRINADMAVSNTTYGYGKTIGWQLIEGRDFSSDYPTDSTAIILNESAVREMGFRQPIGQIVQLRGKPFHVIGVIRNIIFESPYTIASSPSIFSMTSEDNFVLTLKLNRKLSVQEALARIKPVFTRYNPGYPFDFRFVDQEYGKKFSEEERFGKLAGFFTLLAIFISCLGLFGMVAYMAEQRKKEIGVRKVLGASVPDLWRMLSNDFVRLVIISLLVSAPIAYYCMHLWLQQYEYRYPISWTVFVIAGSSALAISLLTVSYQAIKAARANPVKALRSE